MKTKMNLKLGTEHKTLLALINTALLELYNSNDRVIYVLQGGERKTILTSTIEGKTPTILI